MGLVTFNSVSEAIERLKSQNLPVTQKSVRDSLGGGSYSDIQKYIKQIAASSTEALNLISDIWHPVIVKIDEIAADVYNKRIVACKLEIDTVSGERDEANLNIDRLESSLSSLNSKFDILEVNSIQLFQDKKNLEEEVNKLNLKIETLISSHDLEIKEITSNFRKELHQVNNDRQKANLDLAVMMVWKDQYEAEKTRSDAAVGIDIKTYYFSAV
jgi:chromosome segregation ATPase